MDAEGVSQGWLLREACHLQWMSIAARLGVQPTEFRDRQGHRVLPSVVAATLNGDAARFREDDLCDLYLTEHPNPENGWRGQVDLVNSAGGHVLRAEIVTAFAHRAGPSNRDLAPADLEAGLQAHRDGAAARRTSVIRRLGNAQRAQARHDQDPPHRVIEIDPGSHLNGVGLVYFAAIHDMLAGTERRAIPDLVRAWPMRDRRVHFYGNLDAGDQVEIISRARVRALTPDAHVSVVSNARRASDGAVIAASESLYGGP